VFVGERKRKTTYLVKITRVYETAKKKKKKKKRLGPIRTDLESGRFLLCPAGTFLVRAACPACKSVQKLLFKVNYCIINRSDQTITPPTKQFIENVNKTMICNTLLILLLQ
jgi:hypothetical protein